MAIVHSLYRDAGTPAVDPGRCTACGLCTRLCPAEVLLLDAGRVTVQPSAFDCIACGHCMLACPSGAITVRGRGLDPADLTPLPPPAQRADSAQLAALLRARRSIRHFTQEEVAPEVLHQIVAEAALAPMGIPPWDLGVTVVVGRAKVQELAGAVIDGYRGLLRVMRPWLLTLLRPVLGTAKYQQFSSFILPLARSYVASRDAGRDTLFYDAPALLLFHASPYADTVDAAIAVTYAMLAAESRGLGSCIIGGAPPVLQRNPRLCRTLGIPVGNRPVMALIVGHPAIRFQRAVQRHFTSVTVVE